jgi:anti-anti-sigma factor
MSHEHQSPVLDRQAGGEATVVRLTGGHLALTEENVSSLEVLLTPLAEQAAGRQLVLDFANVEFITSAALDSLVRLHLRLRAAGGGLAVRDLDDNVYEVFEVAGLVQLLDAGRTAPAPGNTIDVRLAPPAVLVVDDDPGVRSLLGHGLVQFGFKVGLAASGREALERYRRRSSPFAVVLLDVGMPGWSGPQTLAALRRFDPQVRCCFMTGDPTPYTVEGLLELGAARVFPKPFVLVEVALALRLLAEQPRSRA